MAEIGSSRLACATCARNNGMDRLCGNGRCVFALPQLGSNMMHGIRRYLSIRIFLVAATLGLFGQVAHAQDPVEDLRRLLASGGPADEGPEALDFRKSKIQDAADRMKSIGQLQQALTLDEWKVDPERVVNENLRLVDTEMRKMVGGRLRKALDKMATQGNGNARLAVANLIAEMGPTVRSIDPAEKGGYCRSLEPLVAKLCQDPELGVRQEALRALGNINGPTKDIAAIFQSVLQKDTEVGPRRLAADGLQQMIKVTMHLQKRGQTATGVAANRKDLLEVLQTITPVAAVGVKDADGEVRMLSLQAVQKSAQALAELLEVPEEFSRPKFPQVGRVLTPAEVARVLDAYKQTEQDLAQVKPTLDALRKDVTTYADALRDPEPRVRLEATRAFENLGNARLKLVRRANNLPTIRDPKNGIDRSPADLLKQADFMQPVLDRDMPQVIELLKDPDMRIRRSTAEALETLEGKAEPAMVGLIAALQDSDRFVRWTSLRTLGFMPPANAGPAILPLAKMLSDQDINLRIAAASSLEALAACPSAKDAIPALAMAIRSGDVEARQAAFYALRKIGPNPSALTALIGCLTDRDPRIVRAACETIDEMGPPAAAALPALRRLIGNDDADVRAAASRAILSILRLPD